MSKRQPYPCRTRPRHTLVVALLADAVVVCSVGNDTRGRVANFAKIDGECKITGR